MVNARFGHFPQPTYLSAPDRVRQRCFAPTPPRRQEALGPVTAVSEETRFALLARSGSRLSSREPREAPAPGSAARTPVTATGPRVPPAPYPHPHPWGCRDLEKAALLLRGGQRRPRRRFTPAASASLPLSGRALFMRPAAARRLRGPAHSSLPRLRRGSALPGGTEPAA